MPYGSVGLSQTEAAFVRRERVARLATADARGRPHVIPVCFVFHDGSFWAAIDEKPKRTLRLKRLRNIAENPRVALLIDRYDDDWNRLAYVLVEGEASLTDGSQQAGVLSALRERYPQYREMRLEERPLIRVQPEKVVSWGALEG